MKVIKNIQDKQNIYSAYIPLTVEERARFDGYSQKTGLKKGRILRNALLEYLEKEGA